MNMVAMLFVDRAPRPYLLATDFFTSMLTVIATCALQKNFLHTTNHTGLAACVAMLFLNTTCYCLFLEGPAFSYAAEIWPSHFRGQGYALAMGMLALTCIVWLQSAPTAFATIGWKFYILFIIVGAIATVAMLLFYPDTLHKPLEEVAALFGDEDLVAVYQKNLDNQTKMPVDVLDAAIPGEKDENIHVSHDEVERAV
jgi:MFS family permease